MLCLPVTGKLMLCLPVTGTAAAVKKAGPVKTRRNSKTID